MPDMNAIVAEIGRGMNECSLSAQTADVLRLEQSGLTGTFNNPTNEKFVEPTPAVMTPMPFAKP